MGDKIVVNTKGSDWASEHGKKGIVRQVSSTFCYTSAGSWRFDYLELEEIFESPLYKIMEENE